MANIQTQGTDWSSDDSIDLTKFITYRISRINAAINRQATRLLADNGGLTLMQWRVLVMIDALGETSPAEFVRRTNFDKGQLSRCISGMISKGLINSTSHASDQRSYLVSMTPAGRKKFEQARPHMRARQEALSDSFSTQELTRFFSQLDRLDQAIHKVDTQG